MKQREYGSIMQNLGVNGSLLDQTQFKKQHHSACKAKFSKNQLKHFSKCHNSFHQEMSSFDGRMEAGIPKASIACKPTPEDLKLHYLGKEAEDSLRIIACISKVISL
eukprot:15128973-Ditylum_brightwellii.AAC.1